MGNKIKMVLEKIDEKLLEQKYIALFHDTPFKALRRYYSGGSDEEVGLNNAASAGSYNSLSKDKNQPWKIADMLSSSFDRFPIDFKEDNRFAWDIYKSNNLDLFNIFSQTWNELNINKVDLKELDKNFKNFLRDFKNKVNDRRLRYIALWTWLDIWVIKNLKFPLPQDTRIPFFDILDHIYSAVTLVNLTYNGGYLVLIDIPGIQDFIRRGRKFRDLYIGSWIISILMYKFLEGIALDFGPDTIITPTLRLNPFWINTVKNLTGKDQIWEEYKELELIDENDEDWYRYAIIPGTALLILPKVEDLEDEGKVKEYLIKKFYKTWKEIRDKSGIVKEIKKLLDELKKVNNAKLVLMDLSEEEIENTIESVFIPKITIVEVKKDEIDNYRDSTEKFKETEFSKRFLLWPELLKKLEEKQREKPFIKISSADIAVYKVLDNKIKNIYNNDKEKIEICTNCGKLPTIVKFDREYWNNIEIREKFLFKPGERLCIICLFKRLLSSNNVYKNIINRILGINGNINLKFPSNEDIAPNIKYVKNKLNKVISKNRIGIEYLLNRIAEKIEIKIDVFKEIIRKIYEDCNLKEKFEFEEKNITSYLLTFYYFYKRLEEEGRKEKEEVRIGGIKIYKEKVWEWIEKILEVIEEESENKGIKNEILKLLSRKYYSIILADGDNIGELIRGNLTKALMDNKYNSKSNEKLLKNLVEEIVSKTMPERKGRLLKVIEDFIEDVKNKDLPIIQEEVEDNECIKVDKVFLFPVSISYQFAISRSLMISSLLEVKEIKNMEGFVVYAGGDDLMVLSPVDKIIDIINETRKIFSGKNNGWHNIKGYKIPGLGFVGRSYSIVIAHSKEPLNVVLEMVREKEKSKSIIKYEIDEKEFKKNITIYTYTRNPEELIAIPFKFDYKEEENKFEVIYPLIDYLKKIANDDKEYLKKIKPNITRGRIYAIIDNYKLELETLIEKNKELAKKLLMKIIERGISKKDLEKYASIIEENIYKIHKENREKDHEIKERKHVIFDTYNLLKILLKYI